MWIYSSPPASFVLSLPFSKHFFNPQLCCMEWATVAGNTIGFPIVFHSFLQQIFIDYLMWSLALIWIWAYISNRVCSLWDLYSSEADQNKTNYCFSSLLSQVNTYKILCMYIKLKGQYIFLEVMDIIVETDPFRYL